MLLVSLFALMVVICFLIFIDSDYHRMLVGFAGLALIALILQDIESGKIKYKKYKDNNNSIIFKTKKG